jgi:hypothetical protein
LDQVRAAVTAVHKWNNGHGNSQYLEEGHKLYLALHESQHSVVAHYAGCSLGDLYARNHSYQNAHSRLEACVDGFGAEARSAANSGNLDDRSCSQVTRFEDELWVELEDRQVWEAQHAGQFGRLLLRFNQPRPALAALDQALAILGDIYVSDHGDAYKGAEAGAGAKGGVNNVDDPNLRLVADVVSGFKGLVLRVMRDHAAAEPFLRRALRLVVDPMTTTMVDDDKEKEGRGGNSKNRNDDDDNAVTGSKMPFRPLLLDDGLGLRDLWSSSSIEGYAVSHRRWWGRADVREMFLNHGDALVRTGRADEAPAV